MLVLGPALTWFQLDAFAFPSSLHDVCLWIPDAPAVEVQGVRTCLQVGHELMFSSEKYFLYSSVQELDLSRTSGAKSSQMLL